MGFLRRLFTSTPATVDAFMVVPDRLDAVLEVVGEQSYQPNLLTVAGGRDQNGPKKVDHVAALVLEPKNRYDKNAICIQIEGRRVGYLSRQDAVRYGPVARWAAAQGRLIACEARLKGGWYHGREDQGSVGVSLHLGSPGETLMDLTTDEIQVRSDHPWPGQMIAITGESRYQLLGVALDREWSALIATKAGMHVHPRVTKKVQLLVDCDAGGESGNQLKAIEYSITVVQEADFWTALGLPVESVPWHPPSGYRR